MLTKFLKELKVTSFVGWVELDSYSFSFLTKRRRQILCWYTFQIMPKISTHTQLYKLCHFFIVFKTFLAHCICTQTAASVPLLSCFMVEKAQIMFRVRLWLRSLSFWRHCQYLLKFCILGLRISLNTKKIFFVETLLFVIKGNIWVGQKLRPENKFQIWFNQFWMSGQIFDFCDKI